MAEDQVVRWQRFAAAHPEILIVAPDYSQGDTDYIARLTKGSERVLATSPDLRSLLDELDTVCR